MQLDFKGVDLVLEDEYNAQIERWHGGRRPKSPRRRGAAAVDEDSPGRTPIDQIGEIIRDGLRRMCARASSPASGPPSLAARAASVLLERPPANAMSPPSCPLSLLSPASVAEQSEPAPVLKHI